MNGFIYICARSNYLDVLLDLELQHCIPAGNLSVRDFRADVDRVWETENVMFEKLGWKASE